MVEYLFHDKLLRMDFDIHHIMLASRKIELEHAIVRLIVSTLADSCEISNFTKKNIGKNKIKGLFTVRLTSAGKSRIAFVDEKTYEILLKISKDVGNRKKLFPFSEDKIDEIIRKYSPPDRVYDVKKLRSAVINILRDCMFFGDEDYISEIVEGKIDNISDFLSDFHPIFSGMWDADDEEVVAEFVRCYSAITKESPENIAFKFKINIDNVKPFLE